MKKLFHIILTSLLSLSLLTTFLPILPAQASTGIWTQTDWSGGSGQTNWSVTNKYNSQGGDGVYDTATANQLSMKISAQTVVGQSNFTTGTSQNTTISGVSAYGLSGPTRVIVTGGRLIVSDGNNNRVLIWNTIPSLVSTSADVVIGQPDFTHNSVNQGGTVAANTLSFPSSVYSDGTHLFVADDNNNRVLIYNTIPTTNNASADVVVGQADMVHNIANQGGTVAANTLNIGTYSTSAVYSDGTKLFLTDSNNNRVLIYNTIPTTNNASADVVIGQPDFTHNLANQGGTVAANTFYGPQGLYSDGIRLYVADFANNRVLIYSTIPTSNDASANVVIGQPDFVHSSASQFNATANTLFNPEGVYSDGSKIYVADSNTNRVLIYNTIPTSNDASANLVLGQQNMSSFSSNMTFVFSSANSLYSPEYSIVVNNKLIVSDSGNDRVLIYNTIPTSNNASADVVIGQPDMTHISSNQGGTVAANTLSGQNGLYSDGTKLFIADTGNNRVLIYNTIPTTNNASADVVVGQPDMTSSSQNQGGSVSAQTLAGPYGVFSDGTKLFVADPGNGRVLIYNTIPTSNDASADVVIGQPDFVHNTISSSATANNLHNPLNVFVSKNHLFISDKFNNRVLIYNTIPTTNNASADVVVGQPDMTSNLVNQGPRGASPASNTLNNPMEVFSDGTKLYVSDFLNQRVLIYNTIPTTNNASADFVIGQPKMTSNTSNNGGIGANTLYYSFSAFSDGVRLYIADSNNSRLLIYTLNTPHSSTLTSSTYSSNAPYTVWGPLSYTATTPQNTSVSFQVSTDNGSTWQSVQNTTTQTFGPSQTLAYKVTLQNTDGLSTPTLTSVSIPYTTIPGATSSGGGSGITSTLPTPTPTPSISPIPTPTPSLLPTPSASLTPAPTPSPTQTPTPTLSLPSVSLLPQSCSFTKNLYLGITDPQVHCLQIFLNTNGYTLSLQGFGSLHNETNYFGPLTQAALKRFQQAHQINPPQGYFGPITRGFILSLTK